MDISEKELEDFIFEAAKTKKTRQELVNRGLELPLCGKMFRQVNLGSYGVADLINISIGIDWIPIGKNVKYLNIDIIELKKDVIGIKAVCQAYRYLTAVQSLIEEINISNFEEINTHITLIGSGIDCSSDSSFVYLYNGLGEMVDIYTYKLKLDGIWFKYEPHTWTNIEPDFPSSLKESICHPSYHDLKAILD